VADSKIFKKTITKDESRDTGMAMVLLLLIVSISLKRRDVLLGAVVLHVINMTIPQIYRPVAVVWLAFSELLGTVVSKILMAVVFFVIVTPVGMLRRLLGKDSMKVRAFKGGEESVMVVRNYQFTGQDLERPY